MPDVTSKQKGKLGEYLITCYSRVRADPHGQLYEYVLHDLANRVFEEPENFERFKLLLRPPGGDVLHDADDSFELPVRLNKNAPPTNDAGEVESLAESEAWCPDAYIVVVPSPGGDWRSENMVRYPVEIKTGQYTTWSGDQRETFKYIGQELTGRPLLVEVDLSGLPDSYDLAVRRYLRNRDEIRKVTQSDITYPNGFEDYCSS